MIKVIVAPDELYTLSKRKSIKVFIAGGISNCHNWQEDFIELCKVKIKKEHHILFYNPRRDSLDKTNKAEAENQIVWEFEHLEQSDRIIFWFAKGSLNPTALYMLGRSIGKKEIIIGIDPEYERKVDIEFQAKLAGYKKKIVYSIIELVDLFIKDSNLSSARTIGVH